VKIWEQPINFLFKNGQDYMEKFGEGILQEMSEAKGMTEEDISKIRQESL
jgi:hypothetical protein